MVLRWLRSAREELRALRSATASQFKEERLAMQLDAARELEMVKGRLKAASAAVSGPPQPPPIVT